MIGFPKPTPRVIVKIHKQRDLAALERSVRALVKKRDHGRCVVPGCKERSQHLHHIKYRSRGGKWKTGNIASLCVKHHQCVHAGVITIDGDADEHLNIRGRRDLLKFGL